ncbi:Relaxase/Mobilisation nuclease domain-containing protein [Porphyromonas circumdentaria]|uniref:Relaxase/Mobilisation nuclease domain-containing protein n=2 Tax=Porphyromonas circumdentaria TaxID=29524 RepID=A0A1T4PWB5_9PORP|nr:Relaxase/Mobilisation nuclease domain-containing protein [Porphyromonas circumdentaria]
MNEVRLLTGIANNINQIGNYGNTFSDTNEKFCSTKICRELTDKYQLKLGEGKKSVKRNRLGGNDRTRCTIYDAIRAALPDCKNWQQLVTALQKQGIEVQFKSKSKTELIEGVILGNVSST